MVSYEMVVLREDKKVQFIKKSEYEDNIIVEPEFVFTFREMDIARNRAKKRRR